MGLGDIVSGLGRAFVTNEAKRLGIPQEHRAQQEADDKSMLIKAQAAHIMQQMGIEPAQAEAALRHLNAQTELYGQQGKANAALAEQRRTGKAVGSGTLVPIMGDNGVVVGFYSNKPGTGGEMQFYDTKGHPVGGQSTSNAMLPSDTAAGSAAVPSTFRTRPAPRPPAAPKPERPMANDTYDPKTGITTHGFIMPDQARKLAMSGGGSMKPPGQVEQRQIATAHDVHAMGEDLSAFIKDPAVQENIGAFAGRGESIAIAAGAGDPTATELLGKIRAFSAMHMSLYGSRAYKIANDAESMLNIRQSPEALLGALRGLRTASETVSGRHTHGGMPNSPQSPNPSPSPGSLDPEVEARLKALGLH